MDELVVDSSIVIDYLHGRPSAVAFLDPLRDAGRLVTHVVVLAETLVGARDQAEMRVIERVLSEFSVHRVESTDSAASVALLKQYRLSHGVGWHDCLIAATCVRLGAAVATVNEKHFRVFAELKVVRPY